MRLWHSQIGLALPPDCPVCKPSLSFPLCFRSFDSSCPPREGWCCGGGPPAHPSGVPAAALCVCCSGPKASTSGWIVAGPAQTSVCVGLTEPSSRWAFPATCLFAVPWPCLLPYRPGSSSMPVVFQRHIILIMEALFCCRTPETSTGILPVWPQTPLSISPSSV